MLGIRAAVAANDMQLRYRDIELGLIGVVELKKFGIPIPHIQMHKTTISANAMLNVNYRIANL